jgi:hypothetical protein
MGYGRRMGLFHGYDDGDRVRIVVPFSGGNGRRYEAGCIGTIFPFSTTLEQCRETDRYEINLEEDEYGRDQGVVIVQSAYFESASETRREGELRQGDRVRLVAAHRGARGSHEAGKTGTVFTTHVRPDRILHDVALDFSENIRVRRDQLERVSEEPASVTFAANGSMQVSFG